ncbi:hypothetical protein RJT34_31530 [Clitoria ternatea]|uniref:Rx N-terminal domain-containing protein n=1 Tax=Clitoria ternatea TaxID=43366 RepID=A0AAN9EV72_CLITE
MGRALLSAFLHDVSDTLLLLISATKAFIMKPSTYQRKLMASLQILDALVDDAEEKKFTEGGAVKNWLNELQHVVYLLEDILWQWQWQITKTKNTKSLQFFRVLSKSNMHKPDPVLKAQIHDITEKLEALVKKKDFLGLIARVTWRETLQGMPSCSVVLDNYFYGNYPKDYFYGRDEEEKSMLESLLSTSEGEHVKVINIAGKAGAESFFDEHRKLLRTILPVYLPLERAPSQFSPLVLEKVIMQLNPQVFRVLSLTHYDITNLPASIERLSHLYYLDLSYTKLQTLPDSICDLVNLQTLLLTNCNSLTTFPPRICKLINLRCLDVRDSGVEEMPLEIHKLTSLRTLTDFIVSENGQRFGDLEGLTNLKTLTISKLQNVAYAKDASSAKLKEKKSLEDLMLQWGNGDDSNTNEMEKLEIVGCYHLVAPLPKVSNTCEVSVHDSNEILMRNVVKTHSQASLRRVTISEEVQEITPQSYSGFPSTKYTIGSSLSEVGEIADEARMETEYTRNKLPPDIASLDTRRISKLKEPSSGMVPHQVESDIPSIKQKTDPQSSMGQIADIPITTQALIAPLTATSDTTTHVKVETFSTQNLDNQRPSFEMLKVTTLSQLKLLPPNLHSLKIEGCESLEVLPHDLLNGLPTLQELYLISCSSLRSFTYPSSLKTLYARNCARLEFLPSSESRQKLSFLHHLFIGNSCDSLTTLTLDLFPELKILCMWDCPNLESFRFTGELKGHHTSLESLEIRDCPNLKSFPDEGLNAPNLASIIISNCTNLIKLPNDMNSLTSLNSLFLHKNPLIESFPFGGLPSSLAFLSISHCDKLAPQKEWGLEHVNSLTHFELEGGCIGMDSFPEEKLLPSNVNSLRISTLQSLKKLDHKGFQHLNTLQTLEIDCCHILHSLPDEGLPCSLNYVCVKECPMLSLRLKPKFGKDWYKVGHIPHIQIDDQIIS